MNKLIFATAFTLTIAFLTPAIDASKIPSHFIASNVHSGAHPSNARLKNSTHHFELNVRGSALSSLLIDIPEGISIRRGIEVTDRAGKPIDAEVSLNDGKAVLAFSQPVPVETTLSIKMGVNTPGLNGAIWLYHLYGTMAETNQEIPLGTVRIQTYD